MKKGKTTIKILSTIFLIYFASAKIQHPSIIRNTFPKLRIAQADNITADLCENLDLREVSDLQITANSTGIDIKQSFSEKSQLPFQESKIMDMDIGGYDEIGVGGYVFIPKYGDNNLKDSVTFAYMRYAFSDLNFSSIQAILPKTAESSIVNVQSAVVFDNYVIVFSILEAKFQKPSLFPLESGELESKFYIQVTILDNKKMDQPKIENKMLEADSADKWVDGKTRLKAFYSLSEDKKAILLFKEKMDDPLTNYEAKYFFYILVSKKETQALEIPLELKFTTIPLTDLVSIHNISPMSYNPILKKTISSKYDFVLYSYKKEKDSDTYEQSLKAVTVQVENKSATLSTLQLLKEVKTPSLSILVNKNRVFSVNLNLNIRYGRWISIRQSDPRALLINNQESTLSTYDIPFMGPNVPQPNYIEYYYNDYTACLIFYNGRLKLFGVVIDLVQDNYKVIRYNHIMKVVGPFPIGPTYYLGTLGYFMSYTLGCPQLLFAGNTLPSKAIHQREGQFDSEVQIQLKYNIRNQPKEENMNISILIIKNPNNILQIEKFPAIFKVYAGVATVVPLDMSTIRGSDIDFNLTQPIKDADYNTKVIVDFSINSNDWNLGIDQDVRILDDKVLAVIKDSGDRKLIDLYMMEMTFSSATLTKINGDPLYLSSTSRNEDIKKTFKFGKYYVFDTEEVGAKYYYRRVYFMFRPNYYTVEHKFQFSRKAQVNLVLNAAKDSNKSSYLSLFISDGVNIQQYLLDAENSKKCEMVKSFNSTSLKLTPFCPVNIKKDHVTPSNFVVHSLCNGNNVSSEGLKTGRNEKMGEKNQKTSILYFFNTDVGTISRTDYIETSPNVDQMDFCQLNQSFLMKFNEHHQHKSFSSILGTQKSKFASNTIKYNIPLNVHFRFADELSCIYRSNPMAYILIKSKWTQHEVKGEPIIVIYKQGTIQNGDKRLYQTIKFESKVKEVKVLKLKDSLLVFQILEEHSKYVVKKILLDGPQFIYSDRSSENQCKEAKLNVTSDTKSDSLTVKFDIKQPQYRASYKKIQMLKFDQSRSIDEYIQIDGPFYDSNIKWDPIPDAKGNKPHFPGDLKIDTAQVIRQYSLDSEVRFYLDNMIPNYNNNIILGYTFYEPTQTTLVSLFTMNLVLQGNFKINQNCPLIIHEIYKSKELVIVAKCKSKNGGWTLNTYLYGLWSDSPIYRKLVTVETRNINVDFRKIYLLNMEGDSEISFFMVLLNETMKLMRGYVYTFLENQGVYLGDLAFVMKEKCKLWQ